MRPAANAVFSMLRGRKQPVWDKETGASSYLPLVNCWCCSKCSAREGQGAAEQVRDRSGERWEAAKLVKLTVRA